jgi:hypothetical protein
MEFIQANHRRLKEKSDEAHKKVKEPGETAKRGLKQRTKGCINRQMQNGKSRSRKWDEKGDKMMHKQA